MITQVLEEESECVFCIGIQSSGRNGEERRLGCCVVCLMTCVILVSMCSESSVCSIIVSYVTRPKNYYIGSVSIFKALKRRYRVCLGVLKN